MKAAQLEAKINKLEAAIAQKTASRYSLHRDSDANLHIHFADGERCRIPVIPFRIFQVATQKKLFQENIKRISLAWPRRSGKEVVSWSLIISAAVEKPGRYFMIYPNNVRARLVLWDGAISMPDGTSLKFLDMIPKKLVANINNQEMKIRLTNGSVINIIGSDIDPDKLRGTNPLGIVFAEFAFQDPLVFYTLMPALRQNGGWLICQSTFDGMNHFYQMIENNKDDPLWYCRVESINTLLDENGRPYITDEMIEEDRRAGMPEYLIQQEFYSVVQINEETRYYAHAMKAIYESGRLIEKLFMPGQNVYAAWDIGINDCTAITIFQVKRVHNHMRAIVIGYIENNNRDLRFYVDEIRRFVVMRNLPFKNHFLPHDAKKRDFNTGKTTKDYLLEMGEYGIVVPRVATKENGIECICRQLYFTDFCKEETIRLIDCLSNYSKEYDAKLGTYKNQPKHDWASHGVDSFQTMAQAIDGNLIATGSYEVTYIN